MANRTVVARLEAHQVPTLRALVDLLAAVQECWPSAVLRLDGDQIVIETRNPLLPPAA